MTDPVSRRAQRFVTARNTGVTLLGSFLGYLGRKKRKPEEPKKLRNGPITGDVATSKFAPNNVHMFTFCGSLQIL